jgi:hypothetical protein
MTADPARVWLKSWPARHAPNGPGSGRAPTRLVTAPSSTSTRGTQCLLILPRSAIPSPPAARAWRDPAVAHALRAARDNPRIAPEVAAQLPWALRTVTAGSPSSLGLFAAAGYAGPGATGLLGLLGHRTRSQAFAAELVVAAASSIGHGAPTQTSVRPWILTAGTAGSISGSANSDSNRCGTRWRDIRAAPYGVTQFSTSIVDVRAGQLLDVVLGGGGAKLRRSAASELGYQIWVSNQAYVRHRVPAWATKVPAQAAASDASRTVRRLPEDLQVRVSQYGSDSTPFMTSPMRRAASRSASSMKCA